MTEFHKSFQPNPGPISNLRRPPSSLPSRSVRRSKPMVIVFSLGIIAGLIWLSWWQFSYLLIKTDYNLVKQISVSGNQRLDSRTINLAAGFLLNQTITEINHDEASVNLKKILPQLSEIQIQPRGVNQIHLTVTERTPLAVLSEDGNYFLADSQGILFDQVSFRQAIGLPVITLNDPDDSLKFKPGVNPGKTVKLICQWLTGLDEAYTAFISELSVDERGIYLIMDNGIKVYPGENHQNFKKMFSLLLITLEKFRRDNISLEYIDIRFNNELVVSLQKEKEK